MPAVRRANQLLTGFGSTVSAQHEEALARMTGDFTMLATGELTGRHAYALPCGCGKTIAVRAWCGTLVRAGLPYSVMITASRIEELDDIYKQLIAEGIPSAMIGIIHSEPAGHRFTAPTTDNDERQILIVTHMRLKGAGGLDQDALTYRGRPRDVVLWDEACIVSSSRSVGHRGLVGAIGWIENVAEEDERLVVLSRWLQRCRAAIDREKKAQRADPRRKPEPLRLPALTEGQAAGFLAMLQTEDLLEPVRVLIQMHTEQLRLLGSGQGGGGVLTYTITVPPSLSNVAILDASAHIRELVKEDPTIHLDEWFRHRTIKQYSRVAIRHLGRSGGRDAMTKEFSKRREDRTLSKEIAAQIRPLPAGEAVLIFTHKKRGKFDMAEVLRGDLRAFGIDVDAMVPNPNGPGLVPRFNWLTHGRETASNHYKHCSHVFFVGTVHLSDVVAAGKLVGQRDDLLSHVTREQIKEVQRSEIANGLYQGLHRAACRDTVDGQAKATTVYVILHDRKAIDLVASLMPGCRVERWETEAEAEETKTDMAVRKIVGFLRGLRDGVDRVSVKIAKAALGSDVTEKVWRRARDRACTEAGWEASGRSLVRR
ncbi:hypothetical protein [Rhodoplanes sp. SY1]|uniref:hypothetical protein n=1 Tax=Rhodoplanes sp. SY1 TaxID=3166646 RepID=UPI0038B67BB4